MARAGRRGDFPEAPGRRARGARPLHRVRHVPSPGPAGNVRARFGAEGGGDAAGSGMVATRWWLHSALPDLRDHRAAGPTGKYAAAFGMRVHRLKHTLQGVNIYRRYLSSISIRSFTTRSQL